MAEFCAFFVKRGFLIRVTNMIGARISAPSLPGKVDFALQEAKDGRVDATSAAKDLYLVESKSKDELTF